MEYNFLDAKILSNAPLTPEIFSMTLNAPEIAEAARPGQFVMVYLERGELLLPRPISICDASEDTIEIVYQVVGKGTKVLSEFQPGESVKLLGPLGNGFKFADSTGEAARPPSAAIVGGGIGVPPLYYLAKSLKAHGFDTDVFLGFRAEPILIEMFKNVADRLFITTENGSFGHRGYITEVLQAQSTRYDEIYGCGPLQLLRALADFAAQSSIPCQVSMEQRMACGLGTCVGCVVKVGESYVRVCKEGPVFYANEVNFNG